MLIYCNPKGSSISLPFLISYLFLFHAPATTARTANCTGDAYTTNSTFQTNLKTLFSSLSSLSSTSNSNKTTVGTDSDRVYGLYLCQGDLPHSHCQTKIQTAVIDITRDCPLRRQGIIWYDDCFLRYSDIDFFGVPDTSGFFNNNPNQNTSSLVPFEAVSNMVEVAPYRQPLLFAANASAADSLYTMAQCTVDLSSDSCSECLRRILADIKDCCIGSPGWQYLAASCWIRYESFPFFDEDVNSTYSEIVQEQCSSASFPPTSLDNTRTSLKNLLSNLTSNARPTGFYNTTAGEYPGRLYGLALCRADLATPVNDCNNCLTKASRTITGDCPNNTQGILWYDMCLLRYSNESFFGVVDDGGRTLCGQDQVTEASNNATFQLASTLVWVAANSTLMFAANEVKINDSLSSYVMVQCTRDLSSGGCKNCLQKGMSMLTNNCMLKNGWRYLSGSCTVRYEVYPFFNTSVISSGTLAPQPTSPEKDGARGKKKSSKTRVAAIVVPILGVILLGPFLYYFWWRLRRRNGRKRVQLDEFKPSSTDLSFVDLAIIQAATSNFSDANKLGEGGFGPVYKGILRGGREIAVKRLSVKSKQGAAEFKNEVKLIAKLQHRNLVRMLGCCVEREEKLLIYEYLPNKSLDAFLFDPDKRAQLDWRRRHNIIAGIARGLLYLHEDSLLKVIHRDLKASNVLLDNGMNPKISDFGMAKIYEADESETNTNRIVGTYGYMAPEYAMDCIFSVKSDVYSFGVLLLEILSGQKNGRLHFEQHGQTLLRRAWQLWHEGTTTELMDPLLGGSYPIDEAMKFIHIGLLCVQENAEQRPTVSSVVLMLRSEQMVLPQPAQPPTFIRQRTRSTYARSINEVTNSDVVPR